MKTVTLTDTKDDQFDPGAPPIRRFRQPGTLEAVVKPLDKKSGSGGKCGDALLLHFSQQFFAVADSPDSNPHAAEKFLQKVKTVLEEIRSESLDDVSTIKKFTRYIDIIIWDLNKLITTILAQERTTFTGLVVFNIGFHKKALLLHNGDSLLYFINKKHRKIKKISETNHCLIGKYDSLYQVCLLDFDKDSIFLIATDGFADILRHLRNHTHGDVDQHILDILDRSTIDKFLSTLLDSCDLDTEQSDDIGMIILNPNKIQTDNNKSLIL